MSFIFFFLFYPINAETIQCTLLPVPILSTQTDETAFLTHGQVYGCWFNKQPGQEAIHCKAYYQYLAFRYVVSGGVEKVVEQWQLIVREWETWGDR